MKNKTTAPSLWTRDFKIITLGSVISMCTIGTGPLVHF